MKSTLENRMMHKWRAKVAVLALTLAAPVAALAQNMIQSISASQQAGSDVVRIELSEPLPALPNGFAVQAPPRVAIDLPGVVNGMGKNAVEINQGNLRSANVAQSGDRTRLVLNLRQAANYRVQLQGKSMIVLLDPASAAVAPAAGGANTSPTTHFASAQNAQAQGIREVDFRRGADGAGRVIVDLPSTQVGVDIRQQGQSLVVEFLRSTLPENLRRRLDVADFGTPVQTVSTFQSGDRVRMVVEPKGNWEHSAYQTDNQFVLEVRPMKVDPNKLTQGPGFSGEKLSLNFQNIEVRALLQVIADFTNFNVVTSDTVTGTVTLRLKDVPWDQALYIILQSKGLGVRKSGNVLWIAPKDELSSREQAELEARRKIADLEPTRTQAFQLNYTKAETIAKSLVGSALVAQSIDNATGQNSGRILSSRGSVIFEQRTNQLFVTDIPSKLEEVQAMIAKIDIPVRQVLIEARIVEARDNWGQSLGVRLGFANLAGAPTSGPGAQVGGNYAAVGAQTGQAPPVDFANTQFVNLPANTGALGAAAATFALSLFSASADKFLNLELSALEQDGNGKIVSSPRVITADQVEAVIEQGEEIPYQQATSSGATAVTFRQATLRLRVVPQITPEGFVLLDLDVNKDAKAQPTLQGYTIDKKHVKTQVLVENGGTVVIGGIFTQENLEEINKVPLLGDIPYMGWLFKNRLLTTKKTELLVFITPKIVTDRSAAR